VVARAAPVDRRAALGALAGAVATAFAAAPAEAYVNAAQESTGGLGRKTGGRGSLPKSTTEASMSSYTLEGIKKRGVTPGRKAAVLKKAREEALKSQGGGSGLEEVAAALQAPAKKGPFGK